MKRNRIYNAVISIVDTGEGGRGKSFEVTRALMRTSSIEGAPKGFRPVSPSAESRQRFGETQEN